MAFVETLKDQESGGGNIYLLFLPFNDCHWLTGENTFCFFGELILGTAYEKALLFINLCCKIH